MSKSHSLVPQDRVIVIPPSLALCLSFLPGVDDRDVKYKDDDEAGVKTKPRTSHLVKSKDGDVLGVKESVRGLVRGAVLVQVNHRLLDSAVTDRRLAVVGERRWYARSYAEWKMWDFPYIPKATLTKAFQDLEAAGIILARSDRLLLEADPVWASRKELMRLLSVYNRKAFSVDQQRLDTLMAADARVQRYFATMFKPEAPADQQADEAEGSDQPDQTVRSGRSDSQIRAIRQSDQPDQTVRSGRSEGSDQADQRSSESESESDQILAESSAAAAATPPDPAPLRGDLTKNRQAPELDNVQQFTYMKLMAYQVDPAEAKAMVLRCSTAQIDAWLDYVKRANMPGSQLKRVENPGGFLKKMLEHPDNYPRPPAETKEPSGERFTSGPYSSEIKH